MLWARFDCQSPSNPKLIRAGAEAAWLWHASICYSNLHHLDGKISKDLLPALYLPLAKKASKLSKILCQQRLWHDRGDHFEIHDYAVFQEQALKEEHEAKLEAKREYERERKRAQRDKGQSTKPVPDIPGQNVHSESTPSPGDSESPRPQARAITPAHARASEPYRAVPGRLPEELFQSRDTKTNSPALMAFRWLASVSGREDYLPQGKWHGPYEIIGSKPEVERSVVGETLKRGFDSGALTRKAVTPQHIVDYWVRYSAGEFPFERSASNGNGRRGTSAPVASADELATDAAGGQLPWERS